MNFTLEPAQPFEKPILENLLEKYDYEFSQYDQEDVSPLGLYGYDWLDCYWTSPGRHPFLLRADGVLAGFAMVGDHFEARIDDGEYNMSEFFVMYKYRRLGAGRLMARELFRMFPGRWELKLHPKNLASAVFWPAVVGAATGGRFEVRENVPGSEYGDGTPARFLLFDTGKERDTCC